MKKIIVNLFVAVAVIMLLTVIVQPAMAGSDKKSVGKILEEKANPGLQGKKININTANLKTLSSLKGVGPERAKNIIDYRSKNGVFKSTEDLKKVKGIGEKVYSKIAPLISIK